MDNSADLALHLMEARTMGEANHPTGKALRTARALLPALSQRDLVKIEPDGEGGITFTWHHETWGNELSINGDGTASYLPL